MEKFNAVQHILDDAQRDAFAFYLKGNQAAGTRLRKAMQELKVLANDLRNDVMEKKTVKGKKQMRVI